MTDENEKLVRDTVDKVGFGFPVALVKSGAEDAYGIKGFPTHVLVDADGRLVWQGSGHEWRAMVPELLRAAVAVPATGERSLEPMLELLEERSYGKAHAWIVSREAKGDAPAVLAETRAAIESSAAARLSAAEDRRSKGSFAEAREGFERLATLYAGLPEAERAREAASAIASDPAAKADIEAAEDLEKAVAELRKGKKSNRTKAERMLDRLISSHGDTPTGARAKALRSSL